MNYLEIKNNLESALSSFWTSTPILWENTLQKESDTNSVYIVPSVQPADSIKIESGVGGLVNTFGLFSIRIVGKADGTGTRTLLQYADNLNNHFSNTFFGATHTETGKIENLGITDNRYELAVLIPYNHHQKPRS